ncbi:Bacterial regulatory protein, tetR family [Pirellulimonas nuda]|uniref:Bacterial regulatory protein, tetR family n=1 Tax=Pirellulimonas nuda TaxID=2528009 RepID=A0A518D5G1_9BACT|nr:TetR/AcrR family transcriptional regulator [Pirellulimonas nuda]QDU86711.1 Bacterial regulatory protein, tetR family [Pirellulimonas nuda]
MVAETRKQREIRRREEQILCIARRHLCEAGYLGLSMDRIAEEIEYSKGTVYQHFRNKEEILLALANAALETRTKMFQRAAQSTGGPRVRMAAVGAAAEAFLEQFPHFFIVEQIVRATSIWEKTSADRRQLMQHCESRCMEIIGGIVRDAVACGDLRISPGGSPEDIVFGLWSINWGAQTIMRSSDSLPEIGLPDPLGALRRNQNAMLDGHGWRPFSTEYDFNAYMDQVKQELFDHGG